MNSKASNKKKKDSNFLFDFVKITGSLPALLFYRPKNIYTNKQVKKLKRVLICSNHNGFADPILLLCIFWYRRFYSFAASELFNGKLKSFFFRNVHCIPVDRNNFSMKSFHEVVDKLNKDNAVIIFPEGHINTTSKNEILKLKAGAIIMAFKAKTPILPIYMAPKDKWYKRSLTMIGDAINVMDVLPEHPTIGDFERVADLLRDEQVKLKEIYEKEYK